LSQDVVKSKAEAHKDAISAVKLNNDGGLVISVGLDKRIYIRDAKSLSTKKAFGAGAGVRCVAVNANTTLLAAGAANTIDFIDLSSGKPIRKFKEHSGPVNCVAFNPITNILASGSDDKAIKLWTRASASKSTLVGHDKEVTAVVFSADGLQLISGGADNAIKIWNVETGEELKSIDASSKGVTALDYNNDGKSFVSGGENGVVIIWKADGSKVLDLKGFKGRVNNIAFSPDGQYVAAAGENKTVIIWKTDGTIVKELEAHPEGTGGVAFSETGNRFATGGTDGKLTTWNTKSLNIGARIYATGGGSPVLSVLDVTLNEDNRNGIIEAGEKSSITLTISNTGSGPAFNIVAMAKPDRAVTGLTIATYNVGNIAAGASRKVLIRVTAGDNLEAAAGSIVLSFVEATGSPISDESLSFQTGGGSVYSYVMITEHSYSSGTGKAEIGAPISLKLKMKNVSKGEAKNVKINYNFPEGVFGVNKRFEVIPSIAAGATTEVLVEFYASPDFKKDEVKISLTMEGTFNNADDLIFAVKIGEDLPPTETIAINEVPDIPNQPVYRGGNPLDGLNVNKAKTMVIGKYYALIIGVDNYKGEWSKLNNAVRDAKAVEALLRSKYKFDYFKILYNETATRAGIIKQLEWLVKTVKAQDNVFIYYSGHGDFKKALNKGYWVPVDATTSSTSNYISNSDIQTYLNGVKSKHTLLVSDACFSGDIFRGHTVSVPFAESEKYYKDYKEVHNLASRQAITSGGLEPVMDGGRDGHSVFAYYFLKTLRNNNAKYFDAGQLYTKIKIPVINNSEQTPKLSPIKGTGDEGGQFIFIKK